MVRVEEPKLNLHVAVAVLIVRGRFLTDLLDTLEPIRVGSELVSETGGSVGKLSRDEPNTRGELSSEERDKTGSPSYRPPLLTFSQSNPGIGVNLGQGAA